MSWRKVLRLAAVDVLRLWDKRVVAYRPLLSVFESLGQQGGLSRAGSAEQQNVPSSQLLQGLLQRIDRRLDLLINRWLGKLMGMAKLQPPVPAQLFDQLVARNLHDVAGICDQSKESIPDGVDVPQSDLPVPCRRGNRRLSGLRESELENLGGSRGQRRGIRPELDRWQLGSSPRPPASG